MFVHAVSFPRCLRHFCLSTALTLCLQISFNLQPFAAAREQQLMQKSFMHFNTYSTAYIGDPVVG